MVFIKKCPFCGDGYGIDVPSYFDGILILEAFECTCGAWFYGGMEDVPQ
jgi:hypothetical protein